MTLSILVAPEPQVASFVVSLEEITPCPNRTRGSEKGKSKADASAWDYVTTALGRAHNVITYDELKGLSEIPSHELVNHHIHKLVQVFFICIHFCKNVHVFLFFPPLVVSENGFPFPC